MTVAPVEDSLDNLPQAEPCSLFEVNERIRTPKQPQIKSPFQSDGIFGYESITNENPTGMLSKKQVRQNRIRIENDV